MTDISYNNMDVAKQQREVVLSHIDREGSITSFQAIKLYNITRLAARVHDLRKLGYNIETKKIDKEGGHAFARYVRGEA